MKVTIITVSYNSGKTVEQTIQSVLSQDYPNIEYIIVDGGSTDNCLDIFNRYRTSIAQLVSEPDKGIYDAMNKGLHLATGDLVAFLNADDIYTDNRVISNIVEAIQLNQADCCYGDLVYFHPSTHRIVRYWKTGTYKKGAFLHGWVLPHPVFFCKREVFEKYGGFIDTFQIAGDFELMLRVIEKRHISLVYLPKVLVKMRSGGKATTWKGIIRGNLEIIRSFRLNGFSVSPWFFILKPWLKVKQVLCRNNPK